MLFMLIKIQIIFPYYTQSNMKDDNMKRNIFALVYEIIKVEMIIMTFQITFLIR